MAGKDDMKNSLHILRATEEEELPLNAMNTQRKLGKQWLISACYFRGLIHNFIYFYLIFLIIMWWKDGKNIIFILDKQRLSTAKRLANVI